MKTNKILVFHVFVIVFVISAFGQNSSESFRPKKRVDNIFIQNGKNLSTKQLLNITKSNPKAYKEMKKAKAYSDVAKFAGYMGGCLIGWPLITFVRGEDPNWKIAAISGGFIGLSLPLSIGYHRHANKALKIYLNSPSYVPKH